MTVIAPERTSAIRLMPGRRKGAGQGCKAFQIRAITTCGLSHQAQTESAPRAIVHPRAVPRSGCDRSEVT
jgi:hypothetical protein